MEHYFIYICSERPSSEEQTLVLNHINSLLPIPENIGHIYADINSLPILKCNSSYLAVINACSEEKTIKWTKATIKMTLSHLTCGLKQQDSQQNLVEDSNKIPIMEDSIAKENILEDNNIKDDIDMDQILSTQLHKLADELPISGSYKLDVIISQNVLKELSISKDLDFAGSLYRLFRWHCAHTTIVITQEEDESNMKEWCDIIDAEVLKGKIDAVLGPVIWRGSVQFKIPDISYPGFQLRLDPFENEIIFDDTVSLISDLEKIPYEHLILSPNLQVMNECSFTSIPIYLVLPIAFRLYICEPNVFNESSKKLLECFSQKIGAALIVRLRYSILHEAPKPDKSLSTSRWQKMISSANIKCSDNCFPVLEKYLTFAITTSAKSGNVVYPLRDPSSLDAKIYFNILKLKESTLSRQVNETSEKNDLLALKVPYLPHYSFQALINKINLFGLCLKGTCCKNEHLATDGSCCLLSLMESVTKRLSICSLAMDKNELHITKEEIDPSDWPERVHLLQKQMQTDNEKKSVLPNVFLNFSPQRAQNTISFACQDAEKYFLPTGEPKNVTNSKSVPAVTNNAKPVKQDFEKLSHSEWPGALTCKYDDIYYNCGKQAEDKESVGNEMVRFYVQHETACTCNSQQLKTDSSIVIRTKSKPSNLKWRSPATPRSFSRMKQRIAKASNRTDTNVSQSNITIGSSSRLKKSTSTSSVETMIKALKGDRKLPGMRSALPVRSSPRKKNPVTYSQSDTRNSGENQRRTSDPQQLSEIFKKKLRVAVASALEKNGIDLKDPFFRPCGKRLFTICQAFVQDIPRQKGSTSQHMQKIADAHVKQVIEFERQKETDC